MTALPQISRFIDSNITEGDFKVALSELRDYLNGLLGEDGTPATAGKKLNLPMSGVLEKTQDCTATSADKGKVFRFTGASAMTLSLDAAMALGDGWNITVINDSSADLVIDPYAGETIDGNETLNLGAGLRTGIVCDGTRMMTTYRQEEPETGGFQLFTGNGTFTVPEGVAQITVYIASGGGGGTGSHAWSSSVYLGNGTGGKGAAGVCVMKVTPGQQIPAVVGAGGAGGAALNIATWNEYLNGAAGGSSSFGEISVPGGGGASLNTNGVDAVFGVMNTGSTIAVPNGNTPGGAPAQALTSGGAGASGYVLVLW